MRPPRVNPRRRSGFTLVEVLIAMTLLATIMVILWGTFNNAYRMRDLATERYDRLRAVQSALRRMQREISMAFVTKIGEVPTNEEHEVTYRTAFIGTDDRLDFTAFAHLRTRVDEVASEQCELSYYLRSERGEDGRFQQQLVRREQAPIDGDPEEGGYVYVLLEDVESIQFEYWEPERAIAGEAWERSWDTREVLARSLPPRVRITLEIPDPIQPRETLTYTVQAEIPLNQPIGFATTVIDPGEQLIIDGEIVEGFEEVGGQEEEQQEERRDDGDEQTEDEERGDEEIPEEGDEIDEEEEEE